MLISQVCIQGRIIAGVAGTLATVVLHIRGVFINNLLGKFHQEDDLVFWEGTKIGLTSLEGNAVDFQDQSKWVRQASQLTAFACLVEFVFALVLSVYSKYAHDLHFWWAFAICIGIFVIVFCYACFMMYSLYTQITRRSPRTGSQMIEH